MSFIDRVIAFLKSTSDLHNPRSSAKYIDDYLGSACRSSIRFINKSLQQFYQFIEQSMPLEASRGSLHFARSGNSALKVIFRACLGSASLRGIWLHHPTDKSSHCKVIADNLEPQSSMIATSRSDGSRITKSMLGHDEVAQFVETSHFREPPDEFSL